MNKPTEEFELKKVNIAIDGPAGAGKSTIAKSVAKALGIIYLDTGAMYRAVALKAARQGIDTRDADKLAQMVKSIEIRIAHIGIEQQIFLDGEDVTHKIRTPEISIGASNVAAIPAVRLKLVELQREIADKNSIVMDGRDIGTYVLPNAELKIFLNASVEERALRRYKEQIAKGISGISLEEVKKDIEYRDKNDSSREFAPLSKAADAVEIDTTNYTIEQVAEKIMSLIKE
ncbi:MAG: (d)CMP kinase [Clostridia bacterium]|nr:(d)CMP kinase [Clostridia bacterium]